ncbi:hypothetical protein Tco_1093706 [Tanacetum coccineum]|uniref:Uncharacterized protein n=1 Tax=Tanacetum coccineum TaxID=301880 RepID=A0ABQ5IDH9_9ASTR
MTIQMEMMSDQIKASTDYSYYLAKYKGDKPFKGRGKRMLTKKGVEVSLEKIETIVTKASKNDYRIQPRTKGLDKGVGMTLEVPDRPSGSSSSSSSKSKDSEGFLPIDDEASPKKSDAEKKTEDAKDADKQIGEDQTMNEQAGNSINDNPDVSLTDGLKEPVEAEVQSMMEKQDKSNPQKFKKPEEKPDVDVVLQRLIKLEKKVDRLSKIDHINVIETSVQANMMNEVNNQLPKFLPKAVFEVVQPRIETTVRDVLKTTLITLYQPSSTSTYPLTEYELKSNLHDLMLKNRSFLDHEKHLELYNALIDSMGLDEAITKGELDPAKKLNRRHDHDQDPPADKDSKKRKRKDDDTSSSKKGKTQSKSLKEAKAPTKKSATNKVADDDEVRQDDVIDDAELA